MIIAIPLRKYIQEARNDSNNICDVSEKIGDGDVTMYFKNAQTYS